MLAYTDEELDLMDKIGDTLDKIDDTTAKYIDADNEKDADAAQKQAMREIKKYLKELDRLSDMFDEDDTFIAECIVQDKEGEYDALKAIYAQLQALDKTLGKIDESNSKASLNAQKKAEQEIKRILNEVGKYDDYVADEAYLLV